LTGRVVNDVNFLEGGKEGRKRQKDIQLVGPPCIIQMTGKIRNARLSWKEFQLQKKQSREKTAEKGPQGMRWGGRVRKMNGGTIASGEVGKFE